MRKLIVLVVLVAAVVAASACTATAGLSLDDRGPVCCKVGMWIRARYEAPIQGMLARIALPEHADTRWPSPPAGSWQLISAMRSAASMLVQLTRLTILLWLRGQGLVGAPWRIWMLLFR